MSLGADGAACNNRLDMFEEMRLAAVLQAIRHQPGVLPARDVVWMATRAGARTLGLEQEIGSIEVGKRADVIVVDRERTHQTPGPDPYSTLVYAARGTDVTTRSLTARCWSMRSRRCASTARKSRSTRGRPRVNWRPEPASGPEPDVV